MSDQQLYDELKSLAGAMGLEVRSDIGDFEGGICTVKGRRVLLVNRRHTMARRNAVIARALDREGLENVFVLPALRETIDELVAAR